MSKLELNVDQGFYESATLPLAAQSCINLYPKHPETKDASSKGALYRTPGIVQTDVVDGLGRGMFKDAKNDRVFVVAGNRFYIKNSLNDLTFVGGVVSGDGRVSMAWNGTTLCIIIPGLTGYFYTDAQGLQVMTDPIFLDFADNPGGVTSVCTKDSRFIYTTDTEFFIGSPASVNYGRNFDALDYEDADHNTDPIVRDMTVQNELYIFGTESIEIYQAVPGASFPYSRIPGATMEKGLVSRFGIVQFDNSFMFLGSTNTEQPAIWRAASNGATKLSTAAIDNAIQSYTVEELEAVSAWTYSEGGSFFAGFNFPDRAFVYDATASAIQGRPVWHERNSAGGAYRVEQVINAFGKNIIIDNQSYILGTMNRNILDEYGNNMTRTFSGAFLLDQGDSFRVSEVELKVTAGIGIPDTVNARPSVQMSLSKDGANTYKASATKYMGAAGEWLKRTIWRRLGRVPHSIIFKFVTNNAVAFDIYRLDITVKTNDKKGKK